MTQTILSKEQLSTSNVKYRYFRYKGAAKGHNNHKGTHGKDPKCCMACVSVVVASMEFEGKTYFGASFRNDKDQVNRKLGKLIAYNRMMKNIGETLPVNPDAFRDAVRSTHEDETGRSIKYFWKGFIASVGCY